MSKGYVVSDLHLFSGRSQGEGYLPQIASAASQAAHLVLNGDMFDFVWTRFPSIEKAVAYALVWLKEFVVASPNCQIHFVMGNHDNVHGFAKGLEALAGEQKNFHFYHSYVKLGSNLFLHGDVCNYSMGKQELNAYRESYLEKKQRGPVFNLLYECLIFTRLHRFADLSHPRELMAARILHFFETSYPAALLGTKHIYFGHTHAPFSNFLYGGYIFNNTGSAIRALKLQMMEFECGSDQGVHGE